MFKAAGDDGTNSCRIGVSCVPFWGVWEFVGEGEGSGTRGVWAEPPANCLPATG